MCNSLKVIKQVLEPSKGEVSKLLILQDEGDGGDFLGLRLGSYFQWGLALCQAS